MPTRPRTHPHGASRTPTHLRAVLCCAVLCPLRLQVRGSGVHFADLAYLDASLMQGRAHPSELEAPPATLSRSLFATQTTYGTKTIDIAKTTGERGDGRVPPPPPQDGAGAQEEGGMRAGILTFGGARMRCNAASARVRL